MMPRRWLPTGCGRPSTPSLNGKRKPASRHFEQTALIAREMEAYGEKTDLTNHFGFQGRWWVLASFDNTDGKGFVAVYPPEQKLDPKATPAGKAGEATKWQFIDSK